MNTSYLLSSDDILHISTDRGCSLARALRSQQTPSTQISYVAAPRMKELRRKTHGPRQIELIYLSCNFHYSHYYAVRTTTPLGGEATPVVTFVEQNNKPKV